VHHAVGTQASNLGHDVLASDTSDSDLLASFVPASEIPASSFFNNQVWTGGGEPDLTLYAPTRSGSPSGATAGGVGDPSEGVPAAGRTGHLCSTRASRGSRLGRLFHKSDNISYD